MGELCVRVISGSKRGRKLIEFDGDFIRPTTDRVKESMFNLIQSEIPGAVVYDAFAGSGALGIEALSRGAEFVFCTDVDERSVNVITRNYSDCSLCDKVMIHKKKAVDFLQETDAEFDVIFMDPPYNKGLVTPALKVIHNRQLLSDDGIIVVERDGEEDSFEANGFQVLKERKYGRTIITVLARR